MPAGGDGCRDRLHGTEFCRLPGHSVLSRAVAVGRSCSIHGWAFAEPKLPRLTQPCRYLFLNPSLVHHCTLSDHQLWIRNNSSPLLVHTIEMMHRSNAFT